MRQRFADAQALPPLTAVKLLDQVRERVRYLHYSIRTEDALHAQAGLVGIDIPV